MSCEAKPTRLELIQGDTSKLKFNILQGDGLTPEDLTLFDEITFTIKRSNQDSDAAAVWQGALVDGDIEIIGVASAGILEVTIPPTASKLLRTGLRYFWDIQIKSDAYNIYTPTAGTLFAVAETSQTA